jgi:hypothetical protein
MYTCVLVDLPKQNRDGSQDSFILKHHLGGRNMRWCIVSQQFDVMNDSVQEYYAFDAGMCIFMA